MKETRIKELEKKIKEGLKQALKRLKEVKSKEERIGEALRKNIIDGLEKFLS